MPPSTELVADKGYDSQALREWLDARGTEAVIPPRKNRKTQYDYDKAIYKQRNIIQNMSCRLKDSGGALRDVHVILDRSIAASSRLVRQNADIPLMFSGRLDGQQFDNHLIL